MKHGSGIRNFLYPLNFSGGIFMSEMVRVEIISNLSKLNKMKRLLSQLGVSGMTVMQCMGCGIEKGTQEYEVDERVEMALIPKWLIILYVKGDMLDELINKIKKELYTGHIGDGKIFVSDLTNVIRVRTGEEGLAALD